MNFQMAEIDLETKGGQIFTGLFFVINFPMVESQTYILPKNFNFKNSQKLEKVILESPVFANFFEVFASSQLSSRLILQNDIMDRLNDFATNYSQEIYLSFAKNQLFVAIDFQKNLFEPVTFGPEKISNLAEFVEILNLVNDLILTLKLE
jgi:Protein of unknown function (DUF3137)